MKRNLTDTATRNAKPNPDGKPKKHTDGGGLYLLVSQTGKHWRYDYRLHDKRKTLAIGAYPEFSLKDAREKHEEARALLARGVDPSQHKREMKIAAATENTFEAVTLEWLARNKPGWSESHYDRNLGYLQNDVFPTLGKMHLDDITPRNVIKIMQAIESRGAGDAARRVRQIISQIYKYAVTMELATRNPAGDIDVKVVLKPRIKKHFAAMTDPALVGQLLRDIQSYQGSFVVRCALRLSPLVMLRPGNIRAAEWADIDLDACLWRIPIARMKARTHIKQANLTAHIVPLSRQAVEILREIQPCSGRFKYVFPGARGASRPLSENGIRVALRTMNYTNDEITPHGFRGMASTMLNRACDNEGRRLFDKDLIEQQLAHVDGTVRGDYNRPDSADAISQRKAMLQYWADYLDTLRDGAQVLPFRVSKQQ